MRIALIGQSMFGQEVKLGDSMQAACAVSVSRSGTSWL